MFGLAFVPSREGFCMNITERKRVASWVGCGVAFGIGSSFLPFLCMFAVPVFPSVLLAELLFGEPVINDHGANLTLLRPINTVFYALVGGWLGTCLNRKRASDEPRCTECDYLLIGNLSGRCPECGIRFDLSVLKSKEDDSSKENPSE